MIVDNSHHIGIYINKECIFNDGHPFWKCNNCCYSDVNHIVADCDMLFKRDRMRPCHKMEISKYSIYIIRSMLVDYDN